MLRQLLITLDNLKSFVATANPYDIGHHDYNELYNEYSIALNDVKLLETRNNDLLSGLELESMDPAPTLTDYKNVIGIFDISLSVADGFQCVDKWETPESGIRIKEVYRAIRKTSLAIGREMAALDNVTLDDDYKLFGIFRFIDAFGGLELQIANGTTLDENNNPVPPVGYALTQNANLILLWDDAQLKAEDATRGYPLHTAPNIVHEFGHVLDLRIGEGTGDTMGDEWGSMRNEFTALIGCGEFDAEGNEITYPSSALGFNVEIGWNILNRQNALTSSEIDSCATVDEPIVCNDPSASIVNIICLEMELERIADMFLFWIYSDIAGYEFDITNGSSFIADRANAMYSFAHGGEEWTRQNTTLTPTGFLNWIIQAGATS